MSIPNLSQTASSNSSLAAALHDEILSAPSIQQSIDLTLATTGDIAALGSRIIERIDERLDQFFANVYRKLESINCNGSASMHFAQGKVYIYIWGVYERL